MLALAHGDALHTVVERVRRSTVEVRVRGNRESGAGIIWNSEGLVVTNAHVARRRQLGVTLADGHELDADVIAHDPVRDLAALKVDTIGLPSAVIGDSDALRAGELVLAVGSPFGATGAVAAGVVHRATAPGLFGRRWIEADVRLAPGNSGGPLSDTRGRVVGINTMIASGLALAVPAATVVRFLAGGPTPRLGVAVRPALVVSGRARAAALLVTSVSPESAAAEAGLTHGDAIIGVDGRSLGTGQDLAGLLADWDIVKPLRLELVRGGRRLVRDVSLSPS